MNNISAQIVPCTYKKSIESAGFLYTTILHLFYEAIKKIKKLKKYVCK